MAMITYTSPGGIKFVDMKYTEAAETFQKKAAKHRFPTKNGTYVEDMSISSRTFPTKIFFTGINHLVDAKKFRNALAEKGEGKLEHPLYGVFRLVPADTIRIKNDPTKKLYQTDVEVTFFETVGEKYPEIKQDPAVIVLEDVTVTEEIQDEQVTELSSVVQSAQKMLAAMKRFNREINNHFDEAYRSYEGVTADIDEAVIAATDPIKLAVATRELLFGMARKVPNTVSLLKSYGNLFLSVVTPTRDEESFVVADNAAANALVAQSIVVFENANFETRDEALQAQADLSIQFQNYVVWRGQQGGGGYPDPPDKYGTIRRLIANTQTALASLLPELGQRVELVITRNRSLFDVTFELYGSVEDEYLNKVILDNQLAGGILTVERGSTIVGTA